MKSATASSLSFIKKSLMNVIRTTLWTLLLVGCGTGADISVSDNKPMRDPTYVTMGNDALEVLRAALDSGEISGEIQSLEKKNGASIVKLQGVASEDVARLMHDSLHRCGGYLIHDSEAQASDALQTRQSEAVAYTINNQTTARALLGAVTQQPIIDVITKLSSYTNRYYKTPTGQASAEWLKSHWQSLIGTRTDARVEAFTHSAWAQTSVILTIEGTSKASEVVIIGGHLDSTAGFSPSNTTVAPGADDDASGIATLTEVARVALASGYRPERTIKFIGYSAEEVGLRGSSEIAAKFKADGVNVVGALQLDMTNYPDGDVEEIVLTNDYTTATQNNFVGALIDEYLQIRWGYLTCGYACSDHASWFQNNVPVSFPFEAHDFNPNIHTARDTLSESDPTAAHALKFAKLASAYIAELAKGSMGSPEPRPLSATYSGLVRPNQLRSVATLAVRAGSTFGVSLTGSGNVDLLVRFGAAPTATEYDCRPNAVDSNERCELTVPEGGADAFISVTSASTARYQVDATYFAR